MIKYQQPTGGFIGYDFGHGYIDFYTLDNRILRWFEETELVIEVGD